MMKGIESVHLSEHFFFIYIIRIATSFLRLAIRNRNRHSIHCHSIRRQHHGLRITDYGITDYGLVHYGRAINHAITQSILCRSLIGYDHPQRRRGRRDHVGLVLRVSDMNIITLSTDSSRASPSLSRLVLARPSLSRLVLARPVTFYQIHIRHSQSSHTRHARLPPNYRNATHIYAWLPPNYRNATPDTRADLTCLFGAFNLR